MARARSSAVPLAGAFLVLVVYASLYPFSGWRWPPGQTLWQLMALPWPRYFPLFDIFCNLVGYMPLGALICAGARRSGWRTASAIALGVVGPSALSFCMEVTQYCLPTRVPSLLDWTLNSSGALIGSLTAAVLHGSGQIERWHALRDRWFLADSAGGRVLLLLWPMALVFPTPVPLGVGQIGDTLRQLAESALDGTPWADAASDWFAAATAVPPLSPLSEWLAIVLGLLGPCLLAHSALKPGWRRILVALGVAGTGFVATTLSTALNFDPSHALSWVTPDTVPALTVGFGLACVTAWLGRRTVVGLALVALTALVALVAQAPSDPYFAESLQGWEQGKFIHFHGLAKWVGWLWPYVAIAWLLVRLGSAGERGDPPVRDP